MSEGANTRVGVCDFWVAVCAERPGSVETGGCSDVLLFSAFFRLRWAARLEEMQCHAVPRSSLHPFQMLAPLTRSYGFRCPAIRKKIQIVRASKQTVKPRRIPILVLLDAAGWFLLRFSTIVVLGVPVQSILKHPKSMDAPWIWSFWFRLPFVLAFGYSVFPWWASTCTRLFQPSGHLLAALSTVFAPLTTLLYAALAGYAVVSLWSRLEKVRSSLHKEFALLEILEKRIPKEEGHST